MPTINYYTLQTSSFGSLSEATLEDEKLLQSSRLGLCFDWRWFLHALFLTVSLTSFFAALSVSQLSPEHATNPCAHVLRPACRQYVGSTLIHRNADRTVQRAAEPGGGSRVGALA